MKHPPTLIEVIERRARLEPSCSTFDDVPLADLRRDALQIATRLRERGWADQPVLIAVPAGLDYVRCLLGCLYAGAIAVPAYPARATRLSRASERLTTIVEDAGVRHALIAEDHALPENLALDTALVSSLLGERAPAEFDWVLTPERTCLLQYTSGSTSAPRGVTVTMQQLSANLFAIREAARVSSLDVVVSWLPPYHDMGLIGGIFSPLYAGAATYLSSPDAFIRRPITWLQTISERRATITMAPNFAFELCLHRIPAARRIGLDLSSLRVVFDGAEPIDPRTLDAFTAAFAPSGFDRRSFYPCYGLAEATLFVSGGDRAVAPRVVELDRRALERDQALPASAGEAKQVTRLVSCGRPGANIAVRIVDPTGLTVLPDGQIGEIWIAGASVASGYWNQPEAARERFQARLSDGSPTSYLRTGDLGFIQSGELFITGRLKDLIIIRGQNHYPQDIERTVAAVHPGLEAGPGAAFSVRDDRQERLIIVHEWDHRQGGDPRTVVRAVLEAVRVRHELAVFGCVLVRRGSIPRTSSGKVQRRRVRAQFLEDGLDVVERWDAAGVRSAASERAPAERDSLSPAELAARDTHTRRVGNPRRRSAIARFLRARLARIAGISADAIDDHAPLAQYGVDSLHAAQLTQEIEEFLGCSLPATISFDRPTVAALADALSAGVTETQPIARERERETIASADEPIAIVGMSCRFPGAPDLQHFWSLLVDGRDAIGPVPQDRVQLASSQGAGIRFGGFLEGIDRFDAGFFGISPREAARMDPQQRLFLELTWHALEDAGIPPSALRDSDAGVFAGVGTSDYTLLHAGRLDLIDADYGAGHAPSVIANRVSYALDLRGPSMTVDTACSSSLVALHLASQSLRSGECSLAIVGGVNVVLAPEPGVFLTKARTLALDGRCKTFDTRADGFVRSEGCGVIVLKRLRDAQRAGDRIYALVQGSAVNHDGASNGLTAPSGPAQERLLRSALSRAKITPDQLDYIEAHGVGAPLSDAIELSALGRVLAGRRAPRPVQVSSVKTNLGHLEAASGIASVIKTALALTHERIPAHLHLQRVATPAGLDRSTLEIPTETTPWPRGARVRFAGVSAFGIGGTNGHVLLREAPARVSGTREQRGPPHLLALSAKDPAALRQLAAALEPRVNDATLAQLCYSANTGRDHFAYRAAWVGANAESLRAALRALQSASPERPRHREPRLLFAFSERLPRAGAARELYAREPEFRRALDRGALTASSVLDADLLPALLAAAPRKTRPLAAVDPNEPLLEFPQTSAVLMHFALYALLEHWRVRPSVVFGCGVGEYSAAAVAGVMSWLDALRLAARRELLLASLVPGGRIRQTLHQFKTALAALEFSPAHLPLMASSRGSELRGEQTLDQSHWLEHLYAKTDPARGASELAWHKLELCLTLGPDAAHDPAGELLSPGDRLSCLGGDAGDPAQLLGTLAKLYERGCELDFRAFHAGYECDRLELPRYPFQRQRFWLDLPAPAPRSEPAPTTTTVHPFLARTRPLGDSPVTGGGRGKPG